MVRASAGVSTDAGENLLLDPTYIAEVKRLLATGALSQRYIARLTGISRGTVGQIARGKRPDYPRRPPKPPKPVFEPGPPRRCPRCGGMVLMPCLACRVREIVDEPGRVVRDDDHPLRLDLRPDDRARYEEVRRNRETRVAQSNQQFLSSKPLDQLWISDDEVIDEMPLDFTDLELSEDLATDAA